MVDATPRTRVLLISHDIIGKAMAGPGIRYEQFARQLAPFVQLTLAMRAADGPNAHAAAFDAADINQITYERGVWATLAPTATNADVIILPPDTAAEFPQLAHLPAALVIDGYDPLLVEWLALFHTLPEPERSAAWARRMIELQQQYRIGDLYLCASERQRHWWLGQLEAAGRLHPATFDLDHSFRNLVTLAPYGLRTEPPVHRKAVARGIWPGLSADDKLVLWGGGLWPWLDPVTAIRALGRIWLQRQDIKLLFPGTRHPNPAMQEMPTNNEAAFDCAEELGLRDRGVFFGDWVDYADWPSLLLECDVALSLHFDTVETQLAFRSRVFDYIWAGLPTVAAMGDATSDLVRQYGLGRVVGYEDDAAVAAAILALLGEDDLDRSGRFATAQRVLTWERAAEPLVEFCRAPSRAPDRPIGQEPGAPYYLAREADLAAKLALTDERVAELESLVEGYANGRTMRLLNNVARWRARLTGGPHG